MKNIPLLKTVTVQEAAIEFDVLNAPEKCSEFWDKAVSKSPLFDEKKECFIVLLLDTKNRIFGWDLVSLGTLSSSLVHPREVFRLAIREGAAGIICMHNHPSGDPCPSSADIQVTRQLREASRTVGINLLDHVIKGKKGWDPTGQGFYSFREAGLI